MRLRRDIAFGAAVSAAVLYACWRLEGPIGLAVAAPILSLLAAPLVETASRLLHLASRRAMRRHEGRWFAFRGRAMDIHIDGDARCWLRTADARKVVDLPADAVLRRMLPVECRQTGEPPAWRITSEGLASVLAKSTDAEAAKFRDWLERDVARPARNKLARGMAAR